MLKKIILASHHGFCMGVKRAINIAEETARDKNGQVTILNEIVHNEGSWRGSISRVWGRLFR